jgi:hypothetical protein
MGFVDENQVIIIKNRVILKLFFSVLALEK